MVSQMTGAGGWMELVSPLSVKAKHASPSCDEHGDCESSDTKFVCEREKHEPCHGERTGSCENVKHDYSAELEFPVHSSGIEKDADSDLNDSCR